MPTNNFLERIIKKAINNDWDCFGFAKEKDFRWEIQYDEKLVVAYSVYVHSDSYIGWENEEAEWDIHQVIFEHDFAKAIWGDKPIYGINRSPVKQEVGMFIPWETHLQRMVIAKDRIKYLEENIDAS